ncbi:hypothetical protein GPJ56_006816 [Histomonas meleagridis]|uniref:uncharacterized protein n=1 Tax=Histomonas meleagridis TaxID=135588 RepID=UPI00355A5E66|nr:hypothetical protein GPJ56_006816 [Histomonas meleagridis]KAH0800223.1 hypothetical protein GO595_007335 [Histomonas meleagridis]
MEEEKLSECFSVADETLTSMDHFYAHLPNFLHFPPHPDPLKPTAERIDPNDNWTPPLLAEANPPQTENDRYGNVTILPFRFQYSEVDQYHSSRPQKPWSVDIVAPQVDEAPIPDPDWISFQKRSQLIQNRVKKNYQILKPQLPPEQRDKLLLEQIHEKYHLHKIDINNQYPLQTDNPLYKY